MGFKRKINRSRDALPPPSDCPEGPLKQQIGSVCSFPVTLAKCNPIVHRSPNRFVLVQLSPEQQEDWHSQHFNLGAQELFLGFHCHNLPPDCYRIKLNKSLEESEIQRGEKSSCFEQLTEVERHPG